MAAVIRAAVREPLARRSRRELLWSLIGVVGATCVGGVIVAALIPGTAVSVARGIPLLVLAVVLLVGTGAGQKVAGWYRPLAGRLLGVTVAAPIAKTHGFGARLRDSDSWRSAAYVILRLPLGLLGEYALLWWVGVVNLTYPFWWGGFRNHDAGVHLRPVPALTPFGYLRIGTLPGTFVVFACGVGMVLAAPWVTRGVTAVDRRLVVALLGPRRLAERVRHLEESRTLVVDDATATLRRIERDLHDGVQAQLATLAMKLGQAREKLDRGSSTVPFDPDGAFTLVDAAHRHAKEAMVDLRNVARGIHPPVLDMGLDAALATLVARSAVPASLRVDTGRRPTAAVETIAYFSVAELLANVARHSQARRASVEVTDGDGRLRLAVVDDGIGGARVGAGSGLSGLSDRVRAADGRLQVSSPQGGPTTVVVELPLRA